MNLTQLRYFQAVCQYNNVTKAANSLHVSQPSISAAIIQLENEFGIKLFRRIKHRLMLTTEGDFFLRYVNDILELIRSTEEKMIELSQKRKCLRIGVPPLTGTFVFNPLYFAFQEAFPFVNVEIIENSSTKNILEVSEEILHVAFATSHTISNDHLHVLPLGQTQIILCVHPAHRLSKEPQITFDMLKEEPLIFFRKGSKYNELLFEEFNRIGIQPNVLLFSHQAHTIKEFVSRGIAIAFVLDGMVNIFEGLIKLPVAGLPARSIDLLWKKDQYLNNREWYPFREVEQFVSFAKTYALRQNDQEKDHRSLRLTPDSTGLQALHSRPDKGKRKYQ